MAALFTSLSARAEHNQAVWKIATSYPVDTVSGQSVGLFAERVTQFTDGRVQGLGAFGHLPSGGDLLSDLRSGQIQVVSIFAGALAHLDPIFELSTLPFLIDSLSQARDLACRTRAQYTRALSKDGLRLLFVSPWPPTGLWTRKPLRKSEDLQDLRIRTYGRQSADVFASLGAKSVVAPVQQIAADIEGGRLDAVLSSGDGAVGRSFAPHLPNFTAIAYAYPLSFVVIRNDVFDALPKRAQSRVLEAADLTEAEQWARLPERLESNYRQMALMHVSVQKKLDPALRMRLLAAGQESSASWRERTDIGTLLPIGLSAKGTHCPQ